MDESQKNESGVAPDTKSSEAPGEEASKKKTLGTHAKIAVVIGLAIIGLIAYTLYTSNTNEGNLGEVPNPFNIEGTGPIARINGVAVARQAYLESVSLLSQNAELQGADVADVAVQTQIQEQALATLLDSELLLQAAKVAQIMINEAEIDTELSGVELQFGGKEGLQSELENVGLTIEGLRENITEQLTITKYLDDVEGIGAIEVTEEEVMAFYEDVASDIPGDQLPSFEEIRGELETQILSQKQQAALSEVLSRLRNNAEIEILI